MSYSVLTDTGTTITIANGDKIVTEGRTLIVNGIGPYAQGARRKHRLIAPVWVPLSRFSQINNSTLVPEYQSSANVQMQIVAGKEEKDNLIEDGPDQPKTYKEAYLKEATTQNYSLIRVVLRDPYRGLMFPGLYSVQVVPRISSGGDSDLGTPSTDSDGTKRTLNPSMVCLTEQVKMVGQTPVKMGDAKIVIPRHEVTLAELMGQTLFDITPKGSTAIRYRVWPSDKPFEALQSYYWCIYLERQR